MRDADAGVDHRHATAPVGVMSTPAAGRMPPTPVPTTTGWLHMRVVRESD